MHKRNLAKPNQTFVYHKSASAPILDVWLKECRVRQKLSILLRSQTPDAEFVRRFRKEVRRSFMPWSE
jgi:hypothetical protein